MYGLIKVTHAHTTYIMNVNAYIYIYISCLQETIKLTIIVNIKHTCKLIKKLSKCTKGINCMHRLMN